MKLHYLLFLLVFLAGCSFVDLETGSFTEETPKIETIVKDTGNISVHFCPREKCEDLLVGFLSEALNYIHCATYDLDLPKLTALLNEKSKEIDVKVVLDEDNEDEFSTDFVLVDRGTGLMHNKFCVVDGKKVFTGSFNPTLNDAEKNNNNMVLIESKVLAANYEKAFESLWQGQRALVSNPKIELSGLRVENYFCPKDNCGDEVKEELEKAQQSIYFMTYSFTHEGIANVLLIKHEEGIFVQGVFEKVGSGTNYSKYKVLGYQGVPVLTDGNKNNMHHKVFIIDNRTVITGSFNPSKNADTANDENVLIVEDEKIAKKFLEEFELVWGEAQN